MRRLALPVAILIALASAAGAAASPRFVLKGHGWGHGVGLSQYGALGRANDGQDYKQILGFYYDGHERRQTTQNKIRVLLMEGQSSVTLRSSEDFKVGDKTLDPVHGLEGRADERRQGARGRQGEVRQPRHRQAGRGLPADQRAPLSRRPEDLQPRRHARRRQRRRAAGLPLLRRPARDAVELAARGAQGAGGGRPRLRGPRGAGELVRHLRRHRGPGLRRPRLRQRRGSRARLRRSKRPPAK